MLERNVDFVLVGKNYLSVLLGLELLDHGQKVLLLDDDRLSYGNLYSDGIGELEKSLLKGWGEDRLISPLAKIDEYLTSSSQIFHSNYKQLCLGHSPSENLIEFSRKYASSFAEDEYEILIDLINSPEKRKEFDEQVMGLCHRLGVNGFRFRSVQNFDTQFFLSQSPQSIQDLYKIFKSKWTFESIESDDELKVFLNSFSLAYHKTFGVRFGDYQIFHGMLSILSPSYKLDQDKLCQYLLSFFQKKGGQFKKTHVREWKFYKQSPWSLELASFEGIIHPKKVIFLGGDPSNIPIKLGKDSTFYNQLNMTVKLEESGSDSDNDQFLSKSKMLGTDYFIYQVKRLDDKTCNIKILLRNKRGFKLSFIKEELVKFTKKELSKYFPIINWESADFDIKWGSELFFDRSLLHRNETVPLFQKVKIFEKAGPELGQSLKNVHYIGPLREGPLGIVSSLLEIKDGHQFL